MTLTRRTFARGGAALAAATILPRESRGQTALFVRRSVNDLIAEQSPLIESYRRAVDVMMRREVTDKTSWWFQANIHDLPDAEYAQLPSLTKYWRQCPHKNYFFLNWHRAYLHFFERILRKASGDPDFALPYWRYDDPAHVSLPTAFLPDDDEFGKPPEVEPTAPRLRRNPLARVKRHEYVDRRWIGLGDVVRETAATLALGRFAVNDKLDALKGFGGVRTAAPLNAESAGGMEAAPHNLVHRVMGLDGDLGSPETAARDPIFWLHHANVDRLWAKWTDPAAGRVPPVDDEVWMTTKFTFVDENGQDHQITGADVLDTQFQLGYRYDDDPVRSRKLEFPVPAGLALGPGGDGDPAKRGMFGSPAAPVVLARAGATRLTARESQVALTANRFESRLPTGPAAPAPAPQNMRVVLRNVIANDQSPPYDVFLALEGGTPSKGSATSVRLGGLDLFGGAGTRAGASAHRDGVEIIAYDASGAMAELARLPGFDMGKLRVSLVRRSFALATGGEFVPPDPDPPRIGSIELIQS